MNESTQETYAALTAVPLVYITFNSVCNTQILTVVSRHHLRDNA